MMTLLNPSYSMENLIYIDYSGDPSSSILVTRRRSLDRKKQHSERNFLQCFVFGPRKAGKSALLDSFLTRPFSDSYTPTNGDRYAVNVVDHTGGMRKTLVLKEIAEDGVAKLLSNKESLATCDVALFVHDSSDESSWKRATKLLVEVAGHGEDTGYEVPCLIVAAKDDLDSFSMAIQDSTRDRPSLGSVSITCLINRFLYARWSDQPGPRLNHGCNLMLRMRLHVLSSRTYILQFLTTS